MLFFREFNSAAREVGVSWYASRFGLVSGLYIVCKTMTASWRKMGVGSSAAGSVSSYETGVHDSREFLIS
jgi:hypothetical protein